MEPTVLRPAPEPAAPEPASPEAQPAATAAPKLDLSRMEPPKRLAEARLEEVTIDGICGVY